MKKLFIILLIVKIHGVQSEGLEVLGYDCADCHGTEGWESLTLSGFNHQSTAFPLEGNHQALPCNTCHTGNTLTEVHQFQKDSYECTACHLDIHQSILGDECSQCHGMSGWQVTPLTFEHENTQFSLKGAHRGVVCQECHQEKPMIQFTNLSLECFFCHEEQYVSSGNPNHELSQLNHECSQCHDILTPSWIPSQFQHNINTPYSLTGTHVSLQCFECHQGVFQGTPDDCGTCHEEDFEQTGTSAFPNSPSHLEPWFSLTCELCHQTNSWLGARINHNLTDFPLEGGHSGLDCIQCHISNDYVIESACESCHNPNGIAQTNHASSDYNHETHNLLQNCQNCHTINAWSPDIFQHNNFLQLNCNSCHLIEHTNSTNPPHQNNISDECIRCHITGGWGISAFEHNLEQTSYPLQGLHNTVECLSCHVDQRYIGTPNLCQDSACHLGDFESTANPDHGTYGYPADICSQCHNELGWTPPIFDHNTKLNCTTCHMTDYQNATDPVHLEALGFSLSCDNCHGSTATWEGASFDHANINGSCEDCHIDEYNNTINPNHIGAGFGTECGICHISTTNWSESTFDHDQQYFPIYSGEHRNEWSTCTAECHIDMNDYSVFSCGLNGVCHEHIQSDMDDEHDDVNDYAYESTACFDCHPNGDELRNRTKQPKWFKLLDDKQKRNRE